MFGIHWLLPGKAPIIAMFFLPICFHWSKNLIMFKNGSLGYYCRKTTTNMWHKCILYKSVYSVRSPSMFLEFPFRGGSNENGQRFPFILDIELCTWSLKWPQREGMYSAKNKWPLSSRKWYLRKLYSFYWSNPTPSNKHIVKILHFVFIYY